MEKRSLMILAAELTYLEPRVPEVCIQVIEERTLEWGDAVGVRAEWAASGPGPHILRVRFPYGASGEKILIDEAITVGGG